MNDPQQTWWTFSAVLVVMASLGWVISALARRGKYPRLPQPDPALSDTPRDRLRYYCANLVALVVGVIAGAALWAVPPEAEDGVVWRTSTYDHPAGRLIGPLFLMLAVGGFVVPRLAARWVAPGPLLHILWRSAKRQFMPGLDQRPLLYWLSGTVGVAAILLHLGLRIEHTTMDRDGVRWREWPWQSEAAQRWSQVRDLRLVRTFTALTGRVVERPHFSIEFANGETLRLGKMDTRPPKFWEEAADLAAAQSGVAVRRVESD